LREHLAKAADEELATAAVAPAEEVAAAAVARAEEVGAVGPKGKLLATAAEHWERPAG
jgi:hypothetical protein